MQSEDCVSGVENLALSNPASNLPTPSSSGPYLVVPNGFHPAHATSAAQMMSAEQISLNNSQSSSAYNSCPYTPLNSVADEEEDEMDDLSASASRRSRASSTAPTPPSHSRGELRRQLGPRNQDILPSFNSRDMLERIEYKRRNMRAARGMEFAASGETSPNPYPFTPKNSYVESSFDEAYRNRVMNGLENLEPDQIAKKVEEKKKFYRLDLDEAQGFLHGIAEADDDHDFLVPFQIELDSTTPN
ncbi:unnamed protein product [Notodromas monacha]|uniref:Uncharacterized protein n=1 Tax=Notodromas monacha TaxID=399045 RepID=A0A7R9BXK4_9CRUS|nr:unnamed protein product [Notodromas monacha]CAG0922514.1 unnamed protein product [Notodromas monacha]